jgi:MraZ protein
VFLGEFQHTLDDKGRVILPARFRESLSSGLVVTRGMDRCLDVWPRSAYERRVEETRSLPREHKRARWHRRLLTSGAHAEVPDAQGRIVIPATLREFAGLTRELMICGTDEKVEIWDLARWHQELALAEDDYADLDEPLEFPR